MKTIVVGDTHGRRNWKEISAQPFDLMIFIGDYFDTHEGVSPTQQKENFRDIIAFKRANPEKVILLFGNHDFHYLPGSNQQYSGFQEWHQTDIGEMLTEALKDNLMQMAYQQDHFLFTHAGVSKEWCENNGITEIGTAEQINELFRNQPRAFNFKSGKNHSSYGDDTCQSPIWIRPRSLVESRIGGFTHVVGHTTQDRIITGENLILIDTLGTSGEYLCIEDGNAYPMPRPASHHTSERKAAINPNEPRNKDTERLM